MTHLLKIEWLKIKKYNTFWILSGLFLILLGLANYLVGAGIMKLGGNGGDINVLNNSYAFPNVWINVGYLTKGFSCLIGIIIIILTTNEYQFRTNRQNVIDGWKREQFFHAKWGIVVILSLVVTLYTTIEGLVFGITNGSSISSAGTDMVKMLYVFVLTLNYFGLALTLSFFLKKSGMTIIIFLLYAYIIEIILTKLLNRYVGGNIGDFLPMESSSNLLTFPVLATFKPMLGGGNTSSQTFLIVSAIWIVLYYIVGRMRLLKSDW